MCVSVFYWSFFAILTVLANLPASDTVPLEAAFQGQCEHGNPCDQKCFNIHHQMFECSCQDGFLLQDDGYSCLPSNHTRNPPSRPQPRSTTDENSRQQQPQAPLSIHIEVDIDPPDPDDDGSVDKEALRRLGLPTHHVHFVAGEDSNLKQEILRPEDINVVNYPQDEEKQRNVGPRARQQTSAPSLPERMDADVVHSGDDGFVPPPRALPFKENEEEPYLDKVYDIDAYCNLDCGDEGGKCLTDAGRKRCLCPHGKLGDGCKTDRLISWPRFSGHSHLSLPTLTNAYSDLQLSMEFRPDADDGILMITGELADMTGDYLALLLRNGHVELRLDCGTGPGVVRTRDRVHLHRWNRLSVYRHDWGVWLQLNEGLQEEGRSQGLFMRITFAQNVLLGGAGHFRNTGHFLESDRGFVGCIRRLEINNKIYNFEPTERGGDVINGIDTDQCPEDTCSSVPCQNGGVCVPVDDDRSSNNDDHDVYSAKCLCQLGFVGIFCEEHVDVKIPKFDGSTSYLTYFGLGSSSLLQDEIELVFKVVDRSKDGLVLYNGDRNDASGDFMAVYVANSGYVHFAYDNGDGVNIVRSQRPMASDVWTTIRVSRSGRLAILEAVGLGDPQAELGRGAFDELSLSQNLYVGGVPTFRLVSPFVKARRNLDGCVQKLTINGTPHPLMRSAIAGANIVPCRHACSLSNCGPVGECEPDGDDFSCRCPLGWMGTECQTQVDLATTTAGFAGDGYIMMHKPEIAKNILGTTNTITVRLRLVSASGLVLWTGGLDSAFGPSAASDYLMLGVSNGFIHFGFNLGSGEARIVYNLTRVDDGKWHRIRATRTEQIASLKVDNGHIVSGAAPGKLRQLNGNGRVFVGGTDNLEHVPLGEFRLGMVGCVSDLSMGQLFNIDLLGQAEDGANVDRCSTDTAETIDI